MFLTIVGTFNRHVNQKRGNLFLSITLKSLSFILFGSIIIKNNAKEQYYERAF